MSQIFISYAKDDRPAARKIYDELKEKGFSAWLDVFNLRPGQDWQAEIKKAIKNSAIFLACLSKHAVFKRGFVQSELNSALKILDTIPEGDVYLIPVRLEQCEVPSKLDHLQWVDYFEEGGPEKLLDALREYLGSSIRKATDTASGPLKFSSIRIDAMDHNWGEVLRGGSPFDRPCSQYFQLVEFVYADPLFDITVMNTGNSPVILTAIGIEVLTVCEIFYVVVYGVPTAAKIPKSDSYILQIPNIRQRMHDQLGTHEPQEVRQSVTKQLPDPVYLEFNAPYRYDLLLKDYFRHVPNWARIRMWVSTDQGECRSEELETFTLYNGVEPS